jgi:creatinine amidohydrolase
MPGYHLFNELTRAKLNELAPNSLVILPTGATEQHGPHLPVGTDHFAVERISRQAAEMASDRITTIVTPTLAFGSSEHHLQFGGTLSLTSETYHLVLRDIIDSLVKDGFRTIFIVNGHGGNTELVQIAGRDASLRHPISVAAAPYWQIAWEAMFAAGIHQGGRMPGHAGRFETSLIMADRPELVVEPRPHRDLPAGIEEPKGPAQYRADHSTFWSSINGYTDSPAAATAELGESAFKAVIGAVADAFVAFHGEAAAARR